MVGLLGWRGYVKAIWQTEKDLRDWQAQFRGHIEDWE